MRLSTINLGAGLLLGLAIPLVAIGTWSLHTSIQMANAAAGLQDQVHDVSDVMRETSDYLTDQVRAYVVTRRDQHLNLFWTEVETSRRREGALASIKRLGESPVESRALEEAKAESDRLILRETLAMRLVCEAQGKSESEMPYRVAATALPAAWLGLATPEKLALAQDLVFGKGYLDQKAIIISKIASFKRESRARTENATKAAQVKADRIFYLLVAILLAILLVGYLVVGAFFFQISIPVRNHTRRISLAGGQGLPSLIPQGIQELVALAQAYNRRRDEGLEYETALGDSERRLRTHLRMMPLGVVEIDANNVILSWNPAAEGIFGYREDEALGKNIIDLIVPVDLREDIRRVITGLAEGEGIRTNTNRNIRKNGEEAICEWYNTPLLDSQGAWVGWASIVKDITRQREEEEKILWLSHHDPLTGLLNRRRLIEKLEEEALRCRRTGGSWAAIMLDVDHFKTFNDSWGHECGDLVLVSLARIMTESVRATDSVGRWGGEEFLVLLPETDREGGRELAEKIRKRIETLELEYQGRTVQVRVSAGVAATLTPDEGVDLCVRRADGALLSAKAEGRNRTKVAD